MIVILLLIVMFQQQIVGLRQVMLLIYWTTIY